MNTLFLNPNIDKNGNIIWDLVLDANGNIAVASDPYSQAQDAASAIRTFQGECWYDISQGIPYWTQILDKMPPLDLIRKYFTDAAESIPGVDSAQVFFTSFVNRKLIGQVQITNTADQTIGVTVNPPPNINTGLNQEKYIPNGMVYQQGLNNLLRANRDISAFGEYLDIDAQINDV